MGRREALLMTLFCSAIACLPLLVGPGIVNTRAGGDSPFLLVRLQQLTLALRDGAFPPRWMPDAAYGFGYPFFNYYAALPYYIAAALKLLGFGYLWAIKLTQALGFLAAAMTMYGLGRDLWPDRKAAFLAALAYTYAPFHLVNVYVRGDSLSEFYAFVFYPLILWSLIKLRRSLAWRHAAALALSYAGLTLTHNVSALIFSPFLALYILIVLGADRRSWRRWLPRSAAGLLGGLAISAWLWWPALMERDLGHMADMTTGYFHYAGHFRGLELIQSSFFFDYAITAQRTPFVMGLGQALGAFAGLIAIAWAAARPRRISSDTLFSLALFTFSTYLLTPLSRPLWDHLPLLAFAQFPWRFLSVQAFAVALLVAELAKALPRSRWIALGLGSLFVVTALWGLHPERLIIAEQDVSPQRLRLYELFTGNIGSTVRYEYLPRWVEPRPFSSVAAITGVTKAPPLAVSGSLTAAQLLEYKANEESWDIEIGSESALLAFQTYYFPGWRAYVDGQAAKIRPLEGLGLIELELAQGKHRVTLRFGGTPSRVLAEIVSLFSFLAALAALSRGQRVNRRWLKIAAGTVLGLGLVAVVLHVLPALYRSSPYGRAGGSPQAMEISTQTMDFARQPYLHHNPEGVSFGGLARLRGYIPYAERATAGETLSVTLLWDQVREEGLVAEPRLVSLAEPLRQVEDPLAEHRAPLQAGATVHALTVPQETVPGVYLISVRLWDGEREARPITARGETLGTTYLQPIRVVNDLSAPPPDEMRGECGPCLALAEATATQSTATRLDVELLWWARCPITNNYALSVRLQSPEGRTISSLDIQPHYGFYPTSFWQAGNLIPDRCSLTLPEGTPPGPDYRLEIILYETKTRQSIGQSVIAGLSLTQPTLKGDYVPLYRFPPEIDLVRAQLSPTRLEEGQSWSLATAWAAAAKPSRDYIGQITLQAETGLVVLTRQVPLAPGYCTSQWPQHAFIAAEYSFREQIPVGTYRVSVALLDAETGDRYGRYTLPAPLTIVARPREFAIPAMQERLNVNLGGQVRLLGYDLERKGQALHLTLYWQALEVMTVDYKVFVHLFDPAQERIVSQHDAMPRQNTYPTTLWAKGEVMREDISLSLAEAPPGGYHLAVGLYHPQSGERLPVEPNPRVTIADNRVILPGRVQVP